MARGDKDTKKDSPRDEKVKRDEGMDAATRLLATFIAEGITPLISDHEQKMRGILGRDPTPKEVADSVIAAVRMIVEGNIGSHLHGGVELVVKNIQLERRQVTPRD